MADDEQLTDIQLVTELEKYGENVNLPIKRDKRPLLLKKLNHLRARAKVHNGSPRNSTRSKQSSKSVPAPTRVPAASNSSSTRSRSNVSLRGSSQTLNASVINPRFGNSYQSYDARSSNLEALSSDDSDLDLEPASAGYPGTSYRASANTGVNLNHVSAREKKKPQLSDSVLRTMRRRTADLPPRRTRRSEVLELSTETHSTPSNRDESFGRGSEDEIPVPSPARSRLYPDLSKFTSFLSRSREDDTTKFESSDSDLDASTYEVENKSVNTSFPISKHQDASANTSGYSHSSSPASSSYISQSAALRQRTVPLRRSYLNGPRRVQQYRSRSLEILPQILVGIAALFFIALSVTYVVIHKDFFFSWFSSSSSIGSGDHMLLCQDGVGNKNCYGKDEVDKALTLIRNLFEELSIKKGQVLCDKARPGEDLMRAAVFETRIMDAFEASTHAERLYKCCLEHILINPHWNIRLLTDEESEVTEVGQVVKLESAIANMSWWCRLRRSFTHVLYGLCMMIVVIACILLASLYIKYRLKQKEVEQREVYAMVEKIIDILQDHYEQTKAEDSDEPPYLAVQHVRDQLLPPSRRRKLQPIWDKAVDFIAANESRIRLEMRLIHGDEFEVWHWLQPTTHNGKIWQGQAFGENNDNTSNQVIYSPTACLKIRNMFDSNVENEDNWEDNVTDAILEKCKNIDHIVHIYVDVESSEGCVYLKCSTCEAAGRARQALHGWWFDGRLVTVKYMKTENYHKRWPEARNAHKPLRPSTDQMRSLSQPFYRSSLEMT